jgi:hypothetical protein
VTTGTGGLTIAGKGAVTLAEVPVVDTSKLLTVTNAGGVTLAAGIDVKTVAGGLTISGAGKVILPGTKAITAGVAGTVQGGHWSIGTAAGTATAAEAITLTVDGIKGASASAKLSLAASSITVGLTDANNIGATFDSVDVYLANDTASVKIQSGSTGTNKTTLTLTNGAKISGITGNNATGTVAEVTALPGTAAAGIANISAVTGTADDPDAGNYLGIKADEESGTIAATASTGAKDYTIEIATIATATGA